MTAEEENEKYNKPCIHNKSILCVQYSDGSCGCDVCGDCEVRKAAKISRRIINEKLG